MRAHALWLLLFQFVAVSVQAQPLEIPLSFREAFVQQLAERQLFAGGDERVRVWDDGKQCNQLELAKPELHIVDGRVRTRSQAFAQLGTALAGRCLSILHWQGFVEIDQVPALGIEPGTVQFRVVDSRVFAEDGESSGAVGTVWEWVKKHVHPRFERLRIDLNPILAEIRELLPQVYPHQPAPVRAILQGVALTGVGVPSDRLQLELNVDLPPGLVESMQVDEQSVLTEAEMERWRQSWQQWDAFLTHIIKQAGVDAVSPETRAELLVVLIEARQDILPVLTQPLDARTDPVPALFAATWNRLEPVLRDLSEQVPVDSALRYAAFISAADALATLEAIEGQTGFTLNADVLRRMARLANPAATADPLQYSTEVDTELRAIFGFGPALPTDIPEPQSGLPPGALQVRGAFAGLMLGTLPLMALNDSHYASLVERLNGWVPSIGDLNEYLPLVQQLLDRAVGATLNNKKIDPQYLKLFRPLVLATAWQESCWRQFISKNGQVVPIRSSAGAVGIMQVNQHVWRGFYEVDELQENVGYNAMAGSEIVHHYLVDYAIARGEHKRQGGIDNLARATYAMYNGGPRHRDRYRRENVSQSLRAIDQSFWKKYQKVKEGDPLVVAECYSG